MLVRKLIIRLTHDWVLYMITDDGSLDDIVAIVVAVVVVLIIALMQFVAGSVKPLLHILAPVVGSHV